MARIDELRKELAGLDGLRRRADKLRGKRGRIDVSQETLDAFEELLGDLPAAERPDGTMSLNIERLVARIDQKLAE